MGWTGQYQRMPLAIADITQFFEKEFGLSGKIKKTELVVHNGRETTVYMAVEGKEGHVFGLVILMDVFHDERGKGFRYKEMSEHMGPFYFGASTELIGMLSPTENATAVKWRKSCVTGESQFNMERTHKKEVVL